MSFLTEPLLVLEFGAVFKLSCNPASAKLYQASFTLLLSSEEQGREKQGAPLLACHKAPSTQTLPAVLLCSSPAALPAPRAAAWKMALVLKCPH